MNLNSRLSRGAGLLQSDTERHQSRDQDAHERNALEVRVAVLEYGRRGETARRHHRPAAAEAALHRTETSDAIDDAPHQAGEAAPAIRRRRRAGRAG